jgi:hypothetical protein
MQLNLLFFSFSEGPFDGDLLDPIDQDTVAITREVDLSEHQPVERLSEIVARVSSKPTLSIVVYLDSEGSDPHILPLSRRVENRSKQFTTFDHSQHSNHIRASQFVYFSIRKKKFE